MMNGCSWAAGAAAATATATATATANDGFETSVATGSSEASSSVLDSLSSVDLSGAAGSAEDAWKSVDIDPADVDKIVRYYQ
jgi:hypothetical protein